MLIENFMKMSGMQFNKPRFDWEAKDRLRVRAIQTGMQCAIPRSPIQDERSTEGWIDCKLDWQAMHNDAGKYFQARE